MAARAAPMWASVDTRAADGGLRKCLELASVHGDIQAVLLGKEEGQEAFETLSDFAGGWKLSS